MDRDEFARLDALEQFRRIILGLVDEVRLWTELAGECHEAKRTHGFLPEGTLARAVARHNFFVDAYRKYSAEGLPIIRRAHAPELVNWTNCHRHGKRPAKAAAFQSYVDAVGHATKERHELLMQVGRVITLHPPKPYVPIGHEFYSGCAAGEFGEAWVVSRPIADVLQGRKLASGDDDQAVCDLRAKELLENTSWVDDPLWHAYREMDFDRLKLLIDQEFVVARAKWNPPSALEDLSAQIRRTVPRGHVAVRFHDEVKVAVKLRSAVGRRRYFWTWSLTDGPAPTCFALRKTATWFTARKMTIRYRSL